MLTSPTNTTAHSSIKHRASSIKHRVSSMKSNKAPAHRKTAQTFASNSESLALSEDFVLFPDDVVAEKSASTRRERSQRVKQELIDDGLLPAASNSHRGPAGEKLTPLQRATARRDTLRHDAMIHSSEDPQLQKRKPPPAPSPPRLKTPELDEIDENLWSYCSWKENSVKSYIYASKKQHGQDTNAKSKPS